jgi:DNA-binding CsgD family transcriptional regulator/PAS domain-containing protein
MIMDKHTEVHSLIAGIYEAAIKPERWDWVMEQLCFLLDLSSAGLIFNDAQLKRRNLISSKMVRKNSNEHLALDQTESVVTIHYEPLAPLSSTSNIVRIPLLQGKTISSELNLAVKKEMLRETLELLEQLCVHISKSIHIYNHISALQQRNETLLSALTRSNAALFVLNSAYRIIFMSDEAERLLARNPALAVQEDRSLTLFKPEEQNQYCRILQDFSRAGFYADYLKTKGVGIAVSHPDNKHPIRLCFVPLQQPNANDLKSAFIAIFANDPEQPRYISPDYLKQVFQLTPAEITIAQLLVGSYSVAEIAKLRGVTLETARWQMKQLLQKTRCHSQAELVRLLVILGNDVNAGQCLLEEAPKEI